jgi:hypothetical protein
VKGRLDPKTRIRKLEAIDLWEISIVTFPLLPGARVRAVKEARLPSQPFSGSLPDVLTREDKRVARTRSPTHRGWPVDRSLGALKPERLFRKQPHYAFDREDGDKSERMAWRDLVMSERALRAGGRF